MYRQAGLHTILQYSSNWNFVFIFNASYVQDKGVHGLRQYGKLYVCVFVLLIEAIEMQNLNE